MSNKALNRFITEPKDFSNSGSPESALSQDYLDFYSTIGKTIESGQNSIRTRLDSAMNVVLDGNLYSLDGYSNDKATEIVQKKANEFMLNLHESQHDLPQLDTVSLNSALNVAISIPSDDDNNDSSIYYQDIQEENGEYFSVKPSNIIRNISVHPSKILALLKNTYLIGCACVAKELISFIWVFLDTISFFICNSKIKITPQQVLVTLYIQKFASPSIKIEELTQKISGKELQFDTANLKDLALSSSEVRKTINELLQLKVIKKTSDDSDELYLSEKVSLNVVQSSPEM